MAEGGKCRTVEDHFPLNSTLGREEGSGMDGDLDTESGGAGKAVGGSERTWAFDTEQHAGVGGGYIAPAVLGNEVGL